MEVGDRVTYSSSSKKFCCVPQCNSNKFSGLSFNFFPRSRALKAEWVAILKIGKRVTSSFAVCSRHFLASDYIPRAAGVVTKRKCLKKNAIPSINLPGTTRDSQISEKKVQLDNERQGRRNRREDFLEMHLCNTAELPISLNVQTVASTSLDILANVCAQETELSTGDTCKVTKDIEVQTESNLGNLPITSLDKILEDEKTFTGIPNVKLFEQIVISVSMLKTIDNTKIGLKGMVLIALVKIKLNLPFNILAVVFGIPETSCKRYFQKTIPVLADVFRTVVVWPTKKEILKNIPQCFTSFKDVVIVLDCTEVNIEASHCLKCRILTYSHYKGCNTVKFLFGVSPAGHIIFIGDAYGGRASDKFITVSSGVLDKLVPFRDAVMVDKGFCIDNECDIRYIRIVRPSFVKGGKQLSKTEALESSKIARARVHVERVIQRFKAFKIFNGKLDWTMLNYINNIKDIVAGIVNLSTPILNEDKF